MMRTPKKNTLPSRRNLKDMGTQTENSGSPTFHVLEQLGMMQCDVNILKKHVVPSERSVYQKALTPQAKINEEKSSWRCRCKGNCSSRTCGCVKRNNRCNSSCKCDIEVCQNQKPEYSQRNKENVTDKTPKLKQD